MSGDPDTHSGSPPQPAPQVTLAEYYWVPILGEGGAGFFGNLLLLQNQIYQQLFYYCKNLFYSLLFMLHHCQNICIEI